MYAPLNWQQINVNTSTFIPSTSKIFNNEAYAFFERALFQRALSVIDCNVPFDGAVKDFFIWCLFRRGFVAMYQDDKRGFVFQPCTLAGYDFYYLPTRAIITNPQYNTSKDLKIDKECGILKLTPDYMGIYDIVSFYAYKLALLNTSVDMSIVNNRFAYLLGAKTKGAAQTIKKIFDKLNSGETTIVYDQRIFDAEKETPFQFIERQALKNGYITTNQLEDFQTLMHMFDCEVGIPTVGNQSKKERMVVDEANSKRIDSQARVDIWLRTLNESAQVINELFGQNISFSKHYQDMIEPDPDGNASKNEGNEV